MDYDEEIKAKMTNIANMLIPKLKIKPSIFKGVIFEVINFTNSDIINNFPIVEIDNTIRVSIIYK